MSGHAIVTSFRRTGLCDFTGVAFSRSNLSSRFVIDILVDGMFAVTARADLYMADLARKQVGDACYGFSLTLPEALIADAAVIEARLANVGTIVGLPVRLEQAFQMVGRPSRSGEVRWLGGLHIAGWVAATDDAGFSVLVDGVLFEHVRTSAWRHIETPNGDATPVRAFDVHLAREFGDGAVHDCAVLTAAGEELNGSPLAFWAFADGLRDAVAAGGLSQHDLRRAELFDRLVPTALPFSDYDDWRQRHTIAVAGPAALSCAIILVGSGAAAETVESLRAQTQRTWIAASLPATSEPTGFAADDLRRILRDEGQACEVVIFVLAGSILAPSALRRMVDALSAAEGANAVYADLEIPSEDGSIWPLAFSAFDYERMLEQGYCAFFFGLRREALDRSLAAGACNLFRLFSSLFDDQSAFDTVVHLPGPLATLPPFDRAAAAETLAASSLAHLRRRNVPADAASGVSGILPAVRIARAHRNPRTTIIVPTRNRCDLLARCIESILPAVRRHEAEILVVDNDSSDPETLSYLRNLDGEAATVIAVPGAFNFARLNNCASRAARGDLLCLLNNDVMALDADWLDEMLNRIVDDDVGAVAPLLIWPSRVVQHGGVILGPKFEAAHAFSDRLDSDPGYGDLLRVAHECSAVTAACLLTRRCDYFEYGGMDEINFSVNFNDIDYCLKLREAGRRIVFTPHAKLVHLESASRGAAIGPDGKSRFDRERRNLQLKWGRAIAADPYYSPLLSLDPHPFSALASPARSMAPRLNRAPASLKFPAGF